MLLGNAVAMLQNSFCALDDLPGFQRTFHFEALGNQPRVFGRQRRLAGNRLRESDFLLDLDWKFVQIIRRRAPRCANREFLLVFIDDHCTDAVQQG